MPEVAPTLPEIVCPRCMQKIAGVTVLGTIPSASSFERCLRKCTTCGIGVSNARNPHTVTYIHRDPMGSIPLESREGAAEVLRRALNIRNRQSKWARFGFVPTSEDALTWVVFTYLFRSGQLPAVLRRTGLASESRDGGGPTLLLWGVPIDRGPGGEELRSQLENLCESLGERRQSFSEPDVMIDLGADGLVFIEVKHFSGNDFHPEDYEGWNKYLSRAPLPWQTNDIRQSGCYELARNWRLLNGLAANRPVTLVNLGPARLFEGKEGDRLNRFVQALKTSERAQFKKLSWGAFLGDSLLNGPGWFIDFCAERRLAQPKAGR